MRFTRGRPRGSARRLVVLGSGAGATIRTWGTGTFCEPWKNTSLVRVVEAVVGLDWASGGCDGMRVPPLAGRRRMPVYTLFCRAGPSWPVVSQVLPVNPAAAVRGPKHVVTKGATPVLLPAEARRLLEVIDTAALAGLRDQALVSVMLYSFARVSAVIAMRRQDYFRQESRGWLRLHEKGGKRHDVPAHHRAAEALDDYLEAAGPGEAKAPLFQSVDPAGRRLTGRALSRRLVLAMIKRRAAAAELPASTCCHTFRATGITAYLSNGGTLEHAQRIAGHASPKTTKLYDRTADTISVDEIERIVI